MVRPTHLRVADCQNGATTTTTTTATTTTATTTATASTKTPKIGSFLGVSVIESAASADSSRSNAIERPMKSHKTKNKSRTRNDRVLTTTDRYEVQTRVFEVINRIKFQLFIKKNNQIQYQSQNECENLKKKTWNDWPRRTPSRLSFVFVGFFFQGGSATANGLVSCRRVQIASMNFHLRKEHLVKPKNRKSIDKKSIKCSSAQIDGRIFENRSMIIILHAIGQGIFDSFFC